MGGGGGQFSVNDLRKMHIRCAYQCEYIQQHLLRLGFEEMVPLKDYINVEHCVNFSMAKRENIVCYNPKKGLEITKRIIAALPDITWIPLIGMNRRELISTIRKAKIYIDFGNHPGKDRLPRECAMNGCCIITGRRGSAGYFEDVPIPIRYKIPYDTSPTAIAEVIRETLRNYDRCMKDFDYYRRRIASEKHEFEQQVCDIFIH